MSRVISEISEVISEDSSSSMTSQNPWYRMHRNQKSGAVLAWVENEQIILQQFNTHPAYPYNRPLLFKAMIAKTKSEGEEGQTKEKLERAIRSPIVKKNTQATTASVLSNNLNSTGHMTGSPVAKKNPQTTTTSPAGHPLNLTNPINGEQPPKKKLKTMQEGNTVSTLPSSSKTTATTIGNPFISPNGQNLTFPFEMITPGGTEMTTRRHVSIIENNRRKELLFASPNRPLNAGEKLHKRYGDKPETTSPSTTSSTASTSHKRKRGEVAEANLSYAIETNSQTPSKGGAAIEMNLCQRNRSAFPTAKTTMGYTAKEALKAEIDKKKDIWDKNTIQLMKSLLEFSMEHLHCLAFSLAPEEYNPQTADNLGAAGSWINTQMMVLETVAKYFATQLNGAHEEVVVTPTFDMLPSSPLIDTISYEVLLKAKDKPALTISTKIKALALPDRSNWPSFTDATHVKIAAEALLNTKPPSRTSIFSIK